MRGLFCSLPVLIIRAYNQRMKDTWAGRDLPVLETIVELYDAFPGPVHPYRLSRKLGFDAETVNRALWALMGEDPPLISCMTRGPGGGVIQILSITAEARRRVGTWPTGDEFTQRLVTVIHQRIAHAPDETTKAMWVQGLQWVNAVGEDAVSEALNTGITNKP